MKTVFQNQAAHCYRPEKNDKLYSPQMVVTIYKYTIENDLTKKKEKRKKKKYTHKWHVLV